MPFQVERKVFFFENPSSRGGHLTIVVREQPIKGHAASKPTMDDFLASRERMHRVSAEFLRIDLEIALTFINIAQQTSNDSRKRRNCRAARKAYDTVLKLFPKINMTKEDHRIVQRGLRHLRTELEGLGEVF